ncbi:MAG: 3-deoxy-manno-octulosonate cytidylyltransferase [Verrucomicrobia bacterium]|nr:3-deoxy-manno-octulosonate cytidylyltransferase [Verrucomicrobiota bacterium]
MLQSDVNVIAIIPSRMGSSRFAGKPLARMLGLPMIEHVYQRMMMCKTLQGVYVATCDIEIYQVVEDFGGQAIMTSPLHERASDRVAEAAQGLHAEIIVMVQGDEPMTVPEMVERAVAPMLNDSQVQCVNLVERINSEDELLDPNIIKVVMDSRGNALYFSREPIPTRRILGIKRIPVFKQVCVIPFRRDLLLNYSRLERTPLEQAESIDMLRLLEHGYKVRLAETEFKTHAVDTPEDLAKVEKLLRQDPVTYQYLSEPSEGAKA